MTPLSEKTESSYKDLQNILLKNEYLMKRIDELDRAIKVDLNLRGTLADTKKRIHTIVRYLHMNIKKIGLRCIIESFQSNANDRLNKLESIVTV
jgi:hypothetical protein